MDFVIFASECQSCDWAYAGNDQQEVCSVHQLRGAECPECRGNLCLSVYFEDFGIVKHVGIIDQVFGASVA